MMRLSLYLILLSISLTADAKEATPMAEDPVVESKVMAIAEELRCLVCQNQTIADSNAPLAVDLRREVREMVKQGKGKEEVVDFMETRYGDFVRYRPAFKLSTLPLWLGPPLLLITGLWVLYYNLSRRRQNVDETTPLSDEEQQRIASLLQQNESAGEDKK